jgi:hypothetical protein
MWPMLDPSALGARRADGDAPRWQAVVTASSHGASGGEGTRRRPSAVGLRFMLRSGVPLDGLFGLAGAHERHPPRSTRRTQGLGALARLDAAQYGAEEHLMPQADTAHHTTTPLVAARSCHMQALGIR